MNNIHEISDGNTLFTIDDQLFLETLLFEIRGKTISYSSYIKKKKDKKEKELIKEIKNIEEDISENNVDENVLKGNVEELENKKQELEKLRKHKLHGNCPGSTKRFHNILFQLAKGYLKTFWIKHY
jgi:hypothetical protein